nr:gamma carbonic anhydrase family protein [uncultured Moellerella sp.]
MKSNLRPYLGIMPSIAGNVMIDPSSIVIGDARLSEHVSVWPLTVIRADVNYVSIGARTNIQDGSVLHTTHKSQSNPQGNPLIIGEDVTIGHKVMLHGCQIGDRVLVGMGTIILDNAIIENDVIIGAGSLVTQGKRLESGYLYVGSPAKAIRKLTEEERQHLIYSANNYVGWKDNYLTDASYCGSE